MIIENTLDMARLKVLVPKFVKWVVSKYVPIVEIEVQKKDSKLVITDDLRDFLEERNIQNLTVERLIRIVNVPLSVFIMKNNPKYISVAIDHHKLEFSKIIIEYTIGTNKFREHVETAKFCPFKYGLELDPLHKGIVEVMRIEKETSIVKIVTDEGKTRKISCGEWYNLMSHFNEKEEKHNSKFNRALRNGYLLDFHHRLVSIPSMQFTEPLPIEEDIKVYLMRYPKVVV